MSHAIVRTDKMYGTDVRTGLVSCRYQKVEGEPAKTVYMDIDNGNVVLLAGLEDASREVYVANVPAANSDLADIVLVAAPEVMYDERLRNLEDFYNEAGKIVRGYRLHHTDVFSVTKDALDGVAAPAVGNVVELKAGTKMNVVASATEGSTVVGKIIDKNIVGRYTYFAIEVA